MTASPDSKPDPKALRIAAAQEPDSALHYAQWGRALLAAGDAVAARPLLQRAVTLRPDWQEGWHSLCLIEAFFGRTGGAIEALRNSGGGLAAPLPGPADLASVLGGVPKLHPPVSGALRVIYRISDGGYPKPKIADKRTCLRNFLDVMALPAENIQVVADNCGAETLAMIAAEERRRYGARGVVRVHETSLGNGHSWIFARNLAMEWPDEDVVYLIEDDYLHRPGSAAAMLEGLERADYVSLYDHADKYMDFRNGGNPLVSHGGELTRLIRTKSCHWKFTQGTTMTFAVRVGTLRADSAVFDRFADRRHPDDYRIFVNLILQGRTVLTPVPGLSTHGEPGYLAPGVDWQAVADLYRDPT